MDNDIIWAAGFIDGEGCININRVRYYRNKKIWYYQANISCGQTVKGEIAVKKLQSLFGGYIYRYQQRGNKLPTVTWAVRSKDARAVAQKLIPYLLLKKRQAELLLKLQMRKERKLNHALTKEEHRGRELIFNQMKKLNAIGADYQKRLSEETSKEEATV